MSAVRAVRARELQKAREDAGFTLESLARRILMERRGFPDHLGEHDERKYLPYRLRVLTFMERVSQHTYDRTVEWYSSPTEERRRGRPRIYLPDYDTAFRVISLGNADATLDELRDAQHAATRATAEAAQVAARARVERHGREIVALVWNHADDLQFLDMALFNEIGACGIDDLRYLVRSALYDIAHELRVSFPNRQHMEVKA